ncbi:MAG: hypothetical protein K8F54_07475 [Altibacter sp.]|uniref:hypothetical protein n=1 Tax=Altibacter sp. TaxID=2024823 RepID=UPI001D4F9CB3|nr:hypothetical protein [Altibacter sp.]MBZ0327431.1 hypothetical protein [Altibacter sp.]
MEVFAEVGYFYLSMPVPDTSDYIKKYTVGIPLQTRFRFLASNKINVGLDIYGNINGAGSIIALGPFVPWTP